MLYEDKDGNKMVFNGETSKARDRRLKEDWFSKYAPEDQPGLDIGCNDDTLNWTFRRWDMKFGDGDGTYLEDIPNDTYQTVYASHVLEHVQYPQKAIKRWFDVVRPGGHLIVIVPHRDMYEKKRMLPSNWNPDHKHFWLPEEEDLPCTKSLMKEITSALSSPKVVSFRVIDTDYNGGEEADHPAGEYSIEAIIQKSGRQRVAKREYLTGRGVKTLV